MLTVLLATALMIALTALYVGAEFAAVRARRTRVEQLAERGSGNARALFKILESPAGLDDYVAACQVGITLSSLILGYYGQSELAGRLSPWLLDRFSLSAATATTLSVGLVLTFLTVTQLVLGELVPKSVAIRYPERLALGLIVPMRVSMRLFRPLIWLFNGSGMLLLRLFRVRLVTGHAHLHSPEEIELMVAESGRAGAIDPVERQMLHRAFDLSQRIARQVMIPRNRLDLAPANMPVDALLAHLARSPYSRIPVYEGTPDDILGIVHLKDLYRLSESGAGRTADVVRPVPFVPETKPVGELWQLLNQQHAYLAVVLDEYGGTAGIVTLEDLLEEIIGEVHDEFDVEAQRVVLREGQPPLVRGDMQIVELNDLLGLELPEDEADTVGGLVQAELGRLAERGDQVEIGGVTLSVRSLRGRSVHRVSVGRVGGAPVGESAEGDFAAAELGEAGAPGARKGEKEPAKSKGESSPGPRKAAP